MQQKPTPEQQKSNKALLNKIDPDNKRGAIGKESAFAYASIGFFTFIGQQSVLNLEFVLELLPMVKDIFIPGSASIKNFITIWNVFIASAPFVVVFSIFLRVLLRKLRNGQGISQGEAGIAALMLAGAAIIGNSIGLAPVETQLRGGSGFHMLASILYNYLNGYGAVLLLSSVVVAWFFARTAEILWPN